MFPHGKWEFSIIRKHWEVRGLGQGDPASREWVRIHTQVCPRPEPAPVSTAHDCTVLRMALRFTTEIFLLVFLIVQCDDVRGDGEHEESQEGDQRLGGAPGRLGRQRIREPLEAGTVTDSV